MCCNMTNKLLCTKGYSIWLTLGKSHNTKYTFHFTISMHNTHLLHSDMKHNDSNEHCHKQKHKDKCMDEYGKCV